MNLEELAEAFRKTSTDPIAGKLADLLLDWKTDDTTVEKLVETVDRILEASRAKEEKDPGAIHAMWSTFRSEVIDAIAGMTMNERLYNFSLFERFDAARDDEEKLMIYQKLHASPFAPGRPHE